MCNLSPENRHNCLTVFIYIIGKVQCIWKQELKNNGKWYCLEMWMSMITVKCYQWKHTLLLLKPVASWRSHAGIREGICEKHNYLEKNLVFFLKIYIFLEFSFMWVRILWFFLSLQFTSKNELLIWWKWGNEWSMRLLPRLLLPYFEKFRVL